MVTYYVNDIPFRSVGCQRNSRWKVACFFGNYWLNEYFENVKSTFQTEFLYHTKDVTYIDDVNSTGSIDLTVGGGTAPYSFEWSNAASTEDITGLTKGTYSVIIRDADTSFIEYDTIEVYSRDIVQWVDRLAVLLDLGGDQIRSSGKIPGWNAQGRTSNYLDVGEDGEFEYVVLDHIAVKQIGFMAFDAGFPSSEALLYALYPYKTKVVYASESGVISRIFDNLAVGDKLKMARVGNVLSYYVNDVLMRETIVNPTERWYLFVKCHFTYQNEYFRYVYCTFEKKRFYTSYTTTDITAPNGKGSIDLTVDEGFSPYKYLWSTGDTVQDLDSLDMGVYYVTITDSTNVDTVVRRISIYEKEAASWDALIGVVVSGVDNDTVTSTTSVTYPGSQARAVQYLDVGQDGEFVYIEQYPGENKALGFVEDSTTIPARNYTWAAAFVLYNNQTYTGVYGGPWVSVNYQNPQVGNVFKITRYDSVVSFYRQGVLQKQEIIHAVGKWRLHMGFYNNVPNPTFTNLDVSFVNPLGKFTKCTLESNSPLESCPGNYVQLDASLPAGYDPSDYQFNWGPNTDISCTTCISPIVYPDINTTYSLTYTYLPDLACPSPPDFAVVMADNCDIRAEIDPIEGCCFGNFGAGVYVSSETNLNVYCNLLNDFGISDNGATLEHGQFVNKEGINVKLDWIHNAGNNLYILEDGKTSLFGADQQMKGISSTHYHDLSLNGSGVKEIEIDEYATNSLNLNDNELAATNHTFQVTDPNPLAVSRGNGFVSTKDANGYLERITDATGTYLYPMGSTEGTYRYRPVEVESPADGEAFSVHFENVTIPAIISPLTKAPNVVNLHDNYYYRFFSAGVAEDWKITTYYNPADGTFQSIAHWELNGEPSPYEWWAKTPGSSGNTTASTNANTLGMYSSTTAGVQSFDTKDFALSTAGFYVGTTDFGTSGSGSDMDGDGIVDANDADVDGDGIPNVCDVDFTGGVDADGDGIDDSCTGGEYNEDADGD
ncbi:MAG: hypothetical protein JKY54_07375, partial [Flavobacteriales bacterium]|nr:hypothetical protein [Flavobacteriales bacterium]